MIKEVGESSEQFSPGRCEQLIPDIYIKYKEFEDTCESSEETFSQVFAKIDEVSSISELMTVGGELYRDYGTVFLFDVSTQMNRMD